MTKRVRHFPLSVQEAFRLDRSTRVAFLRGFSRGSLDDRRRLASRLLAWPVRMRDARIPLVGHGLLASVPCSARLARGSALTLPGQERRFSKSYVELDVGVDPLVPARAAIR